MASSATAASSLTPAALLPPAPPAPPPTPEGAVAAAVALPGLAAAAESAASAVFTGAAAQTEALGRGGDNGASNGAGAREGQELLSSLAAAGSRAARARNRPLVGFPAAAQPEIMRAAEKDEEFLNSVCESCFEVLRHLFGETF